MQDHLLPRPQILMSHPPPTPPNSNPLCRYRSCGCLKGWRTFAKLAYSSAAMGCLENWAFSSMELFAGRLPDPTAAVAAVGVAFSIYGFLFMGFGALGRAVCVR